MPAPDDDLIHGPLAHWASHHPQRPALVLDAHTRSAQTLSFACLQARIARTSARLRACAAPAICLTGGQGASPHQPDDTTQTHRADIGQRETGQAPATVPGHEDKDGDRDRGKHNDKHEPRNLHGHQQHAADESPLTLLTDFLGIIATGRCAAVADPDWPASIRQRIAACLPQQAHDDGAPISPEASFYIGFTSGSTGLPKGFRRSHRSW
ncbi:MAG: hypothetical protein Q4D19_03865, partial [Lautropia sp.]|nr:hypothetical protein [Lautropia sp.]